MKTHDIAPTQYTVSDFLTWQRDGALDLAPDFQRRSVWKPGARSLLIDTVVRGLPVPLLILRPRYDMAKKTLVRDVVDGQQRLRSLFAYVDPTVLPTYEPEIDDFKVQPIHNAEIGNLLFDELSHANQIRILDYKFSVQVLPLDVSDRDVLEIFARLNSTGQRLSPQELRNAAYFGAFKTLMYEIAFDHLDQWTGWGILTREQISRMAEVELTSDLVMNMVKGLSGKTIGRLNNIYREYDEEFPHANVVASRFDTVMRAIDEELGDVLPLTVFRSDVHFFSLFVSTYDLMFGMKSSLDDRAAKALPPNYRDVSLEISRKFKEWEVPPKVLDAVSRASSDQGRRETRFRYMRQLFGQSVNRAAAS